MAIKISKRMVFLTVVTMLLSFMMSSAVFADDDLMSDWGRPSVYFMASKEIIKGVGDNRFNPLGSAKVEEALAIALRCVETYKK